MSHYFRLFLSSSRTPSFTIRERTCSSLSLSLSRDSLPVCLSLFVSLSSSLSTGHRIPNLTRDSTADYSFPTSLFSVRRPVVGLSDTSGAAEGRRSAERGFSRLREPGGNERIHHERVTGRERNSALDESLARRAAGAPKLSLLGARSASFSETSARPNRLLFYSLAERNPAGYHTTITEHVTSANPGNDTRIRSDDPRVPYPLIFAALSRKTSTTPAHDSTVI